MPRLPLTEYEQEMVLDWAEQVESYLANQKLPFLSLDGTLNSTLPAFSGAYIATDDDANPLYIGKADDFSSRCRLSQHHRLPEAIQKVLLNYF